MIRLLLFLLILLIPFSAHAAEARYDWIEDSYFLLENDVYHLYQKDGALLIPYEWPADSFDRYWSWAFRGFDENGVSVFAITEDGYNPLFGLMAADGAILLEPQMDSIDDFRNGLALCRKDSLYGFVNTKGDIVIPLQYDRATPFFGGLSVVRADGYYGCIDTEGETVIAFEYTSIEPFMREYSIVSKRQSGDILLYGVIDRNGNSVLECKYEEISDTDDGVYRATLGNDQWFFTIENGMADEVATVTTSFDLTEYWPHTGSKVPLLNTEPTLKLTENLPRLDGATALVPLYSAVAQAVYPPDVRYHPDAPSGSGPFAYSNTVGAYQSLIDGRCDLIFAAGPSQAQRKAAEEAGVQFRLTPIGYEAFVFFVNGENALESITTEQIRSVYSGEITDWSELGVPGIGEIVAYQRPENSGSQTALQRLMGSTPIMEAPKEYLGDSFMMNDIVNVIEYRNLPNAIGYSFRFFLTEMMGSSVKLLSVDGIAPVEENIRNQTYPIITKLYAVSRADDTNPELKQLLDWLQSEQGMELVRKSGYTPYYQYEGGKIVETLLPSE